MSLIARIICLKDNNDLLISIVYFIVFLLTQFVEIFSDPAKSINWNLFVIDIGLNFYKFYYFYKYNENIVWDLDEKSWLILNELILFFYP